MENPERGGWVGFKAWMGRSLGSTPRERLSMRPSHFLGLSPAGFHRIAYVTWGGPSTLPPVVCVHGLTRNGRDFDRLANALARERLVIAPDIVGRGASSWLADARSYAYPQYCADMAALIARLGVDEVDWVGTSMGGLIGMMLAAQPSSPIRRLVLNDVGYRIPRQALRRLAGYVGQDPMFADLAGVEAYLRKVHAPFGQLDDEAWRQLALHGHRRLPDGLYGLAYDPKIGQAFSGTIPADIDLASVWEKVRCPVLLLRGAESDLLLPETASAMAAKAELVEFPAIGHAPSLMLPDQIEIVGSWLARN
jgi:pimeloyl-ACP methyl ester carboxylesterase